MSDPIGPETESESASDIVSAVEQNENMSVSGISQQEALFTAQHELFLDEARSRHPDAPRSIEEAISIPPAPIRALVIDNLETPTAKDLSDIQRTFTTGTAVSHIVPAEFTPACIDGRHPALHLTDELQRSGVIGIPVEHPMERHPAALARFGQRDGTLKLYDLPLPGGTSKYREQAETSDMFAAHNDGLGYAGLIRHVIMVLDRPPMTGGYTYFQNLVKLAPALAESDPEAFEALFLPNAITAIRPRGKGAIRVVSPVFFVGRDGGPQVFFRISSGEYVITWRDHPAVQRARTFLDWMCAPFGPGSQFVHFTRPGDTILLDNSQVVHGRTPFIDPPSKGGRVLARKWFVSAVEDSSYRHVPGISVHDTWATLFPDQFTGEAVEGEWHYDASRQQNVRVS